MPIPSDPNRVVPNRAAADELWAALAANQPIVPTSDPNQGGGVIVVEPEPTDPAVPDPAITPGPTDSAAPVETAVELPHSIPGTTAAQETCSAGNLRG